MNKRCFSLFAGLILCCNTVFSQSNFAHNPIIYAYVPDMSMIRVGETYYMSSTIMEHFMGYRFGLFDYATKNPGGFADFDFLHINNQITIQ